MDAMLTSSQYISRHRPSRIRAKVSRDTARVTNSQFTESGTPDQAVRNIPDEARLTPPKTRSSDGRTCASISIIIPAFNEAEYIEKTLHTIQAAVSRYAGTTEIIVVDNASTDSTGQIATRMGARVICEEKRQIARAKNTGAGHARGDFLVFVDADTTLEGDILEKVCVVLSKGDVIGGGAWVEPDSRGLARWLFKYVVNPLLGLKNVTVGPFLFCDRQAFNCVGGFDEELYAAEEFSLASRIKEQGIKTNQTWKIIKYHTAHRIVTSIRNFGRFGGLQMAFKNIHLLWNTDAKLRKKSECDFWYKARKH